MKITPKYFVDQSIEKQGRSIRGIPVVSLEELALKTTGRVDLVVTPQSLNTVSNFQTEFIKLCESWEFNLHFAPVPHSIALEMRYAIHQENYLNVIDMLYDDFSKASYYEYIRSKLTGETYHSHYFSFKQQYLANDLFTITESDYIVDCGAYDGILWRTFVELIPIYEE
ncbi:hypothetical protein [Paenibacillus paeoniae]|uniref:Uncharacterized protein n=1 Tax=Paenibacillus paeoniae TaxID=2292705 RepID=A0A371P0W1_9BACL|nr:hypothetical protein [Paenibacillus paeoniae]REK69583.1 hypothetical protein DX130_24080 [Paenibacillus paeoniae]